MSASGAESIPAAHGRAASEISSIAFDEISKRIFDFSASLCLILSLSPLFLIIAACVKFLHPEVPVFFGARVLGKSGRPFRMWKFSTMVNDANGVLDDLLRERPDLRLEWEATFKLKDDPRVLPGVGKLLRRTSLDELPQLINVLRGEMSLVGPRPITNREVSHYLRFGGPETVRLRHSIRPGITGLWQVSGRNDVSYAHRVALDLKYLRARSLLVDIQILIKTALKVTKLSGAY